VYEHWDGAGIEFFKTLFLMLTLSLASLIIQTNLALFNQSSTPARRSLYVEKAYCTRRFDGRHGASLGLCLFSQS
jgi:hypothetical protein